MRQHVLRNGVSVVRHVKLHSLALARNIDLYPPVSLPGRYRFGGILEQVYEHLSDLPFVGGDSDRGVCESGGDFYPLFVHGGGFEADNLLYEWNEPQGAHIGFRDTGKSAVRLYE